jgi:hypothetical protein
MFDVVQLDASSEAGSEQCATRGTQSSQLTHREPEAALQVLEPTSLLNFDALAYLTTEKEDQDRFGPCERELLQVAMDSIQELNSPAAGLESGPGPVESPTSQDVSDPGMYPTTEVICLMSLGKDSPANVCRYIVRQKERERPMKY